MRYSSFNCFLFELFFLQKKKIIFTFDELLPKKIDAVKQNKTKMNQNR